MFGSEIEENNDEPNTQNGEREFNIFHRNTLIPQSSENITPKLSGAQVVSKEEFKVKQPITRDDCPYYNLISKYDWNTDVMCRLAFLESSNNPKAYNPEGHRTCSGSFGLLQIGCIHIGKYGITHYSELYDPATNVHVAYQLYKQSGYVPWGPCHTSKITCW